MPRVPARAGRAYYNNPGLYFNGGPVARYRHVMNFGWNYGAWAAQLVNQYNSKYEDANPDEDDNTRNVSANNALDLAGTWSGVKGLAITLGLTNLFNSSRRSRTRGVDSRWATTSLRESARPRVPRAGHYQF